jgi:hypothetical protein
MPICILSQSSLHMQDLFQWWWLYYDGLKEKNNPGAGLQPFVSGHGNPSHCIYIYV